MAETEKAPCPLTLNMVPCPLCDGDKHRPERVINGFELVRCVDCSMVFVNPQPTAEALIAGYNDQGGADNVIGGPGNKLEFYRQWFSERDQQRWRDHLRCMAEFAGGRGRLLEYGCGPAFVGQLAADDGWQVEAIDVGEWIRGLAPERTFPLHVGTLREQDWQDGRFDAVYAQDVLEHLQNPLDELEELARLLRPGGVLYFHVPNYASLTIRLGVSRFAYNEPLGHLNYFTPLTLSRILQKVGFTRIKYHSDHLEYKDCFSRKPFDYTSFENDIQNVGRPTPGRFWSFAREMINIPLNLFRCGTYLWGFAVRR
jgi:SAM-dependent methyltransferase